LGIAAGMICVIAPVYLAEITSSEYRGRIICVQSIIASLGRLCYLGFGALFIYLSRSYFGFNLSEWKVLAAIGLFQGLALLLAMQFLPDSPTWLIVRHDDRESAFEIISRLFNGNNKYAELQVNSLIHADIMADSTKRNDMNTRFYRPLGLCCVLVTLRTISNYLIDPALSPTSSKSYVVSAFGVGLELGDVTLLYVMSFLWLAGVFGTFVCFLLIDVKGRGTVLKFGCGVVIVCCAVLVTSEYNAAELTGSNVLELADSGSAAMLIITAAHHIGLGITPVVLTSELFPARYRTASVSLVVIWEGLVNLAMSYSIPWIGSHFDSLTQVVGLCVSIVVVCNMCAFIIAWLYLPETSRRSLQEIEAILSGWKPATPQQGYSNVRLSAAEPTYGTT
jgi:MFS family permease